MGAHSTQKLIEFRSTKIDEGLPILRAFCGSAIISNDLRSHRKILRRTLVVQMQNSLFACRLRHANSLQYGFNFAAGCSYTIVPENEWYSVCTAHTP